MRSWVLANGKDLTDASLLGTTPLLAQRHLTSIQIPELILEIERIRGGPIDLASLGAGDFADLDTIYGKFLDGITTSESDPGQ